MVSFSFKNALLVAAAAAFALCSVQVQAAPAASDEMTNDDIVKLLNAAYGKHLDQNKVIEATRKNYLCRSNCYIEALREKRKTPSLFQKQATFDATISKEINQVEQCVNDLVNSLRTYKDVMDYTNKTKFWQLTVAQYCADTAGIAQTGVLDFAPVHAYAANCDLSVKKCGTVLNDEMKMIEANASPSS